MDKKEKARLLLREEVAKTVSDELLDFNFDLIEAEVLSYCNRIDFPVGLMLIVIKMVAEYTQANYYKEKLAKDEAEGKAGKVSSIQRGDTTISYGDNAKVTELGSPSELSVDEFLSNYTNRIIKYRKIKAL
ncbi:hypothetical protein B9N49_00565 [Finegoldia magna]|uniref:Phage gp6-like head-tail connector protein n=1 Tax=Finegoldia magna TaxID=1260 RepID=A0A233V9U3_FINMA|nr:hypothetical protein [Finegoldia magna]OXZ29147.1 hypothetical protein B9N49_00565 [Finegoldia magna]